MSNAPDFSTLNLSRLAPRAVRLADALTTLKAGTELTADARKRYGSGHIGEVIMALFSCRDELKRLGIERGLRTNGVSRLFPAVASFRAAVTQLTNFIESQHRPPTKTIKYPHLPALDWVNEFPPDAVLNVRQAAKVLGESVSPSPAMSERMSMRQCAKRFGLGSTRELTKKLSDMGVYFEKVNRQGIRVALSQLPPEKTRA